MYDVPADHRGDTAQLEQCSRLAVERIAIPRDEIGERTGRE
jgi:hypothetical protein